MSQDLTIFNGKIFKVVRKFFNSGPVLEIVEHPEGVVILPFVTDNEILLIEQIRLIVGPDACVELPAGFIEKGEEIIHAANRELEEECGYYAKDLKHIFSYCSSPGFTNEKIHIVIAKNLIKTKQKLDDSEQITKVFVASLDQATELLKNGQILGAGPCIALLWANMYNQDYNTLSNRMDFSHGTHQP